MQSQFESLSSKESLGKENQGKKIKGINKEYFESILQLRPFDEKVFDFVLKRINERNDVFISKEVKLKTGVDLYLSSNKVAVIIGRMLKKSFKGTIKISKKLYGQSRQSSKLLYRVTVCFRLRQEES